MPLIDILQILKFLKNTYVLETCVDRCTFSMTENDLNLLQLEIGRIQGGEFVGAIWGSRREGGHFRRQPF